jgi:hypothetical protein
MLTERRANPRGEDRELLVDERPQLPPEDLGQLDTEYAALQRDPEAWAEYRRERDAWDILDDLAVEQ